MRTVYLYRRMGVKCTGATVYQTKECGQQDGLEQAGVSTDKLQSPYRTGASALSVSVRVRPGQAVCASQPECEIGLLRAGRGGAGRAEVG